MTAYDDLGAHLRKFRSAPFLFVGAGVSKRYLGLPAWEGLLERFAGETGAPYAYYLTSGDGNLPRVASAIAEAFHDLWWKDDRFAEGRAEFGDGRLRTREGPFKAEIARYMRDALVDLPTEGHKHYSELLLFAEVVIDGVITTNFDGLLEHIFDDYKVYVGQDQLLFSDPQGIGEIYKIHGSHTDPESLVITEADFKQYADRNPYLAAKLLAIFVEHPVVFLGYSMSDANVQQILVSVARCLTTSNLERLQDNLIFVNWDPDVSTPTFSRSVSSVEGFTIPVHTLTTSEYAGLFTVLGALQRKFPARLLRQLKEHVYRLVLTNEPTSKLFVQDIDADTNLQDVDVVFGVGMHERLSSVGLVGLSRRDLLRDVLQKDSEWPAVGVAREALPVILHRSPNGHTPMYRYLRGAGLLDDEGNLIDGADVDSRIAERVSGGLDRLLPPQQQRARCRRQLATASNNLNTLVGQVNLGDALTTAAMIPREQLDLEQLRIFLEDHSDAFETPLATAWAKLVCVYDYYAFGKGAA